MESFDHAGVVEYLGRMKRNDQEKHDCNPGRTTLEIAEYFGKSMPTVRRLLNALAAAGHVEVAILGDEKGHPLVWWLEDQP